MGELLLATTTGPGGFQKQVAIKRLHPEMAANPAIVKMFLDEARISARLRHPNIIEIFDLGESPLGAYIVMEYLDGHDLRAILKRVAAARGKLPLPIAVHIVQAICRGLHHAHERCDDSGAPLHIVHRDVSPQNVIVTVEGHVKVIDFGIAKANGRLGETKTGTIKGKYGYMSPEQARGREVDRRSDVFCAGVLLFELSTTRKLFRGADEYELLQAVVEGRYPRPSMLVSDYPRALERIVRRALEVDVDDRHPTALALHDDLEALSRREKWRINPIELARYLRTVFEDGDATGAAEALVASTLPTTTAAPPTRKTLTMPAVRRRATPGPRRAARAAIALGVVAGAGMIAAVFTAGRGPSNANRQEPAASATAPAAPPVPVAPPASPIPDDEAISAAAAPAASTPDPMAAAAPTHTSGRRKASTTRRVESRPPARPPTPPREAARPRDEVQPARPAADTPPCAKWEPC